MIDPRRYARVMGYSHGQATGHSRRAAHRQATGGQATAMQGRFRHASIWPAVHTLLCPGAGSVTRTHYEINLDQRILDPEICMHACMAGRPAGRR